MCSRLEGSAHNQGCAAWSEQLELSPDYDCTAVLLIAVAGWFILAWHRG